jgi:hypothetical protein
MQASRQTAEWRCKLTDTNNQWHHMQTRFSHVTFWVYLGGDCVTPCSLVDHFQRIRRTCRLHLQSKRILTACGVCGGQSGTGAGFLRVLRFPLPIISPISPASWPDRFIPGESAPGTHWIRGWVDPRACLEDVKKRKFLTLQGLELRPVCRPART